MCQTDTDLDVGDAIITKKEMITVVKEQSLTQGKLLLRAGCLLCF